MSLKMKFITSFAVLILGGALMLSAIVSERDWQIAVGFVLVLAGLGANVCWWRCPNCGQSLGRSYGPYCPHCGEKIDYGAGKKA